MTERYSSVSVRQLTERKNKPWQARAKYKENGKWREITKLLPEAKGVREAKKLAEEWRRELNAQAELSATIDREKTVEEAVAEYLNRQLSEGTLEKSSYNYQTYALKKYTYPYIGSIGFVGLDRTSIEGWLAKLYGEGLNSGTIRAGYNSVRKVYKYFYDIGELKRNPFNGIKPPKKSEARTTHLTKDEMEQYLTAVYLDYEPQETMYLGLLIPFYTGMRRGEVCGLRWRDVDLDDGVINVMTAIGRGKEEYTKGPKNKSSVRVIYMMPDLKEAFQKAKESRKPKESEFVLGDDDFMKITTYCKAFAEFVKRHGLVDAYGKKITPHSLRHNIGYLGITANMDIASLAKMMGHSKRSTTLDIYGDASKDADILASKKLAEKFNNEKKEEG